MDYETQRYQVQVDALRTLRDNLTASVKELEARNAELESKLAADSSREIDAEREVESLNKRLRFVQESCAAIATSFTTRPSRMRSIWSGAPISKP